MSVFQALVDAYDAWEDRPRSNTSLVRISFAVVIDPSGHFIRIDDLRTEKKSKMVAREMVVAQANGRTGAIAPNFLWDKAHYVLGLLPEFEQGEKESKIDRAKKAFPSFVAYHEEMLRDAESDDLRAVVRFLLDWRPDRLSSCNPPDGLNSSSNMVFAIEDDGERRFAHDDREGIAIWERGVSGSIDEADKSTAICLVTGRKTNPSRLHPSIMGVPGGASTGGNIVSFNKNAFESYGWGNGANAPVSPSATDKYTAMLNRLFAKNVIRIADTNVLYWAVGENRDRQIVESTFASAYGKDEADDAEVGDLLASIRNLSVDPSHMRIAPSTRVRILGLTPNASRLSVRFWFDDDFQGFVSKYRRFLREMEILPDKQKSMPTMLDLLRETAVLGKLDNIAPNLAGQWTKSVFEGSRYPQPLLHAVMTRIRADGVINVRRAAILKAMLIRNYNREVPVSLDQNNANPGYLLGRLFAVYQLAQEAAVGQTNVTIKDQFFGSAVNAPQRTFRTLDALYSRHSSKLRRAKPALYVRYEKVVSNVKGLMSSDGTSVPPRLSDADQALFSIGYYHQREQNFVTADDSQNKDVE